MPDKLVVLAAGARNHAPAEAAVLANGRNLVDKQLGFQIPLAMRN